MYAKRLFGCLIGILLSMAGVANAAPPPVRFAELHYDNVSNDVGEAIEVSGPAGTDLTNWKVALYNVSDGKVYSTRDLAGSIPATCGARGVQVLSYPANGIQNGPQDAMALVSPTGVVEFLSYEGVMTAVDGPAVGMTSVDIGVSEAGNEPAGLSLARRADGSWSGPAANTFGACNDDGEVQPPAEVTSVTVSPATATINPGASQTFTASALDASSQPIPGVTFTWTSNAPAVATVSATGVATGVAEGDAVIRATAPNGISNTAVLHVNAVAPVADVRINEIHYDNVGTDADEKIEIESPVGASLAGFSLVLYDGNGGGVYGTTSLAGITPSSCGTTRQVFVVDYPANGIQNGPDGIALIGPGNQVVEFLSYEGVFTAAPGTPAAGLASVDIGASENSAAVGLSLQRDSTNAWRLTTSSFGACNVDGPPTNNSKVNIFGREASEPALPLGFEDQLFAEERDGNNTLVNTTFTWSSDTPAIASIDARGVMKSLAVGTAIFRATATDGTTGTIALPMNIAVAGTTAQYANNTEFGEPQDSDSSDDFIVRYPQYTASYNPNRGTPNWVSYDLEITHFGEQDRCECFTADPSLPASFTHIDTADYTNSGTFAGFGIDRGHMVRSFDRTTGTLDNALTYYFTNIVPQASDLNQGPWAQLENELGNLARQQDKEVYIIDGVAGNKGTLKNEGKVVIPTSTWKIAVILPRNQGLADIHDYRDLQIIAVNMPNEPGVRFVPWQTYITTVDAIEQLTGYDFLALLPDGIEQAAESNTQPPLATVSGPASTAEGSTVTFSAAGSTDPNGSVVSYAWSFGDGTTGAGQEVTHTYKQDGVYTVSVVVTDNDNLTASASTAITVSNVAPVVGEFPGASIPVGQSFTATGSFTDPGDDQWTATVNWGDGSPVTQVALGQRSFAVVHTYSTAGSFTVTVTIADDDTSAARTQTVTVTAPSAPTLNDAKAAIDRLVAAKKLNVISATLLKAGIVTAEFQLDHNLKLLAKITLRSVIAQIDTLVFLRQLSAADAAPLRSILNSVINSIGN